MIMASGIVSVPYAMACLGLPFGIFAFFAVAAIVGILLNFISKLTVHKTSALYYLFTSVRKLLFLTTRLLVVVYFVTKIGFVL